MAAEYNYGTHEVLHMTSFLMNSVEGELLEHQEIQKNEDWTAKAQAAFDVLYELYQSIGATAAQQNSVQK